MEMLSGFSSYSWSKVQFWNMLEEGWLPSASSTHTFISNAITACRVDSPPPRHGSQCSVFSAQVVSSLQCVVSSPAQVVSSLQCVVSSPATSSFSYRRSSQLNLVFDFHFTKNTLRCCRGHHFSAHEVTFYIGIYAPLTFQNLDGEVSMGICH